MNWDPLTLSFEVAGLATLGTLIGVCVGVPLGVVAAWKAGTFLDRVIMGFAVFGFSVPVAVAGVDSAILDPRSTWADKAAYDRQAGRLVGMFVDNFAKFEAHVDEGVRKAAPQAA